MNTTSGSSGARRFTLLIGMLLHLLGAAAIPAFHADGVAFSTPAAVSSIAPSPWDDGAPGEMHDELDCVLCHVSGAVAAPAAGAQIPLAEAPGRVETPAAHHALPHRPASPARARAPPHA